MTQMDRSPNAVTAAVPTVEYRYGRGPQGVVWIETKKIFLQIRSDTPPCVTATVAAVGVLH